MRVLVEITDDKLKELVNCFDKMFDDGIIQEYYYNTSGYSPSLFDYFDARDTIAAAVSNDVPEDELNAMAEAFFEKCCDNDYIEDHINWSVSSILNDFLRR